MSVHNKFGKWIDGSGIVVVNIDTGVQWDHPALKEKYRGYNPSNSTLVDHSLRGTLESIILFNKK